MSSFNFPDLTPNFIPKFEMPEIDTPVQHIWADEQFEILKKHIQRFESSLDQEHEVALWLTNFGHSVLMQVTSISYEAPVLMVFTGFVDGKDATLIQHIHQLNFLLTSVKKEGDGPKRKVGFTTES